jgi:GNAT superfamily N-acetyltransferase
MVLVRATTITDWQALREIRLQALRDAPYAFSSTHAGEAAFADGEWHRRATRDGSFLAFLPEVSPAGLGGGYLETPDTAELIGMYVRPQARGRGVGEAIIEAVAGWATQQGAATMHLWVTETNKPARMLYERCGFTATAERQPLPSNPALSEIGMQRPA